MNFRDNINKIHYNISNSFNKVSINEKSSIEYGNYIELSINESGKDLITIIKKSDLESSEFNWLYKSNPYDKNSTLIERKSSVDNFINDVKDIFEKNRFDSGYIKNIKQ